MGIIVLAGLQDMLIHNLHGLLAGKVFHEIVQVADERQTQFSSDIMLLDIGTVGFRLSVAYAVVGRHWWAHS